MSESRWKVGDPVWCLHCERVYPYEDDFGFCPICGATTLMDGWMWESILGMHPEYPFEPVFLEVEYPMYD